MKKVTVKEMRLVNFKGIRELEAAFNDRLTDISGKNGTGKTTVYDAFTWALFGKDSQDRKQFDIKTLGKDGKPLPDIPHEVSVLLDVDGEEIRLTRRFTEQWVKPRGEEARVFKGNEEERLYNGVPMSLRDWNAKIEAICPERVFKAVTSPTWFTSQKPDQQRAMLLRMAGGVRDADITEGDQDLAKWLAGLTGKTIEERKREIAANKRRLGEEIATFAPRIDERKRDITSLEAVDFQAVETELKQKKALLAVAENCLLSENKRTEEYQKEIERRRDKTDRLQAELINRESEVRNEALREWREKMDAKKAAEAKMESLKREAQSVTRQRAELDKVQLALEDERRKLLCEWRAIRAEEFKPDGSVFVCPTCGRRYQGKEFEDRRGELLAKFNADKARRLEANKAKGMKVKEHLEATQAMLTELAGKANTLLLERQGIEESEAYRFNDPEPDTRRLIEEDIKCQDLRADIKGVQALYRYDDTQTPDLSGKEAERQRLKEEMETLTARLAKRDELQRSRGRVGELEAEWRKCSQAVADLEREEMLMRRFEKRRSDLIEGKVNALFQIVRFKLTDTLINGQEVDVCEATVDGVPYSSQNNAMRINMGLDIINAISKAEGVCAPIFVDNAESVNSLLTTEGQMIRLNVTCDETLRIG
ncbi:MAG: AAA family ATPase [Prevotellaceae bacterium]|nr:AAA family ATPase [Prevotellaceae bacterium]